MSAHLKNLTQQAKDNGYFRHVLATGGQTQVVIMSIPPGGDIGEEVHADTDQVLYLVEGSGQVILEGEPADFRVGDLVLVTAGTRHNFKTVGEIRDEDHHGLLSCPSPRRDDPQDES